MDDPLTPATPATDLAPHRQAWDLIPWLVAGSASQAEATLVQQHAAACADCREELAFHHHIKAGMQADAPVPHGPDAALAALWARIDETQAAQGMPATTETPARTARNEPRWTRWLVAAVLVQAVGLATLAGLLFERPRVAAYQTFSSPVTASTAATAPPAMLRLVPAASMPVGRLQVLLDENSLQIVASSRDGRVLSLAPAAGTAAFSITQDGCAMTIRRMTPGVMITVVSSG